MDMYIQRLDAFGASGPAELETPLKCSGSFPLSLGGLGVKALVGSPLCQVVLLGKYRSSQKYMTFSVYVCLSEVAKRHPIRGKRVGPSKQFRRRQTGSCFCFNTKHTSHKSTRPLIVPRRSRASCERITKTSVTAWGKSQKPLRLAMLENEATQELTPVTRAMRLRSLPRPSTRGYLLALPGKNENIFPVAILILFKTNKGK